MRPETISCEQKQTTKHSRGSEIVSGFPLYSLSYGAVIHLTIKKGISVSVSVFLSVCMAVLMFQSTHSTSHKVGVLLRKHGSAVLNGPGGGAITANFTFWPVTFEP